MRDPNHEGPSPSLSAVPARTEVGPTCTTLPHPQPANGEEKGWAMVLRRDRTRRVLLRTGNDNAAGSRKVAEGGHFLPGR